MSRVSSQPRYVDILLVEDNPGDIRLVKKAFEKAHLKNDLHVVKTGKGALDFLHGRGEHPDDSRADLVLLDLKLPDRDGLDVLRDIKTDPKLKRIPVVILTSSDAEEDVITSYERHANAYLTKPVDFPSLVELVRELDDFWLTMVTFAPSNSAD